jgi:hypothetical protein
LTKENGAEAGGNQVNATERRKTLRIRKEGGRSQSKERIKGDGYVFDDSRADSKATPTLGPRFIFPPTLRCREQGSKEKCFRNDSDSSETANGLPAN